MHRGNTGGRFLYNFQLSRKGRQGLQNSLYGGRNFFLIKSSTDRPPAPNIKLLKEGVSRLELRDRILLQFITFGACKGKVRIFNIIMQKASRKLAAYRRLHGSFDGSAV